MDGVEVVAIDALHLPARHGKAFGHVFADGQIGAAVVGDGVVIPEQRQFAQLQMASEGNHFLAHALLQTAVAHKRIGAVIDHSIPEPGIQKGFGHGHAQGVGDALAQGPRGDFNAQGGIALGVASAMGIEFAKALDLVEADAGIAAEVQQGIQQHGAVPVGEDHPIAVEPRGVGRVVLEVLGVEGGGDFGHAQWHPLMTFRGLHDGVDGQKADGVGERLQGVSGHGAGVINQCLHCQGCGAGNFEICMMNFPHSRKKKPSQWLGLGG